MSVGNALVLIAVVAVMTFVLIGEEHGITPPEYVGGR